MFSEQDCKRVAAEADLDVRTVRRVFEGHAVRSNATYVAIEQACMVLGLDWTRDKRTEVQR